MKVKQRIFDIIQAADPEDKWSKVFDITIILLILVNVCMVIADTYDLPANVKDVFYVAEVISVVIFTVEYLLRIWTADLLYPNTNIIVAKIRYVFSFLALIDLLSILPFYLPMFFTIDLRVLRMLRIIRLLRVFKISRYTDALRTIGNVFKTKQHELLSSIFVVTILMIVASVLMFSVENEAQPDVFKNAFDALWWALATLTTVGYGDIYPVTVIGRILSAIIAILGIGLVAVPTGIISAGFVESFDKEDKNLSDYQEQKHYCPYCGKHLD